MSKRLDFEVQIAVSWPPEHWQDIKVLLAVSGGADSVAMLRALRAVQRPGPGSLEVAHANHQIRLAQSDTEEQFVTALCERLGVHCYTGKIDVPRQAADDGDGMEAAARRLRYQFLQQVAEQTGARYLVTAHTADDQAETILHRIVRGTGLRGLAGIPRARPLGSAVSLIRPMLWVWRTQVLDYLQELGQPYMEDTSNQDLAFTRNRIRHELLPSLAAHYNQNVREALCRLGTLSAESRRVIDKLVDELWKQSVARAATDSVRIRVESLRAVDPFLVREFFIRLWHHQNWPQQQMGYLQWEKLAGMVRSATATSEIDLPGGVRAELHGSRIKLSQGPPACNHP